MYVSITKDTNTNKTNKNYIYLFPPSLEGKKLERSSDANNRQNRKHQEYLEQYLKSKNPDFLVKAVKENPALLREKGRNLDVEQYLYEKREKTTKPSNIVDQFTIVDETIRWWQNINQWHLEKEEPREAKKLLSKILSPIDIIPRKESKEVYAKDGLKHVTEKVKGKSPYLTYNFYSPYYMNPEKFVERYEHAKKVFQESKTKKRYGTFDKQLEEEDTLKALKKLGFDYKSKDIRHYFNLSNAHTKAISYLCMLHTKNCPLCKRTGLSDDTILRLLKRVRKEIQEHDN